jgi:hypothetical protein
MKKAELLITPVPSGTPVLKGRCSVCPNITFTFVGDTAENHALMRRAFDRHIEEVHTPNKAGKSPVIAKA